MKEIAVKGGNCIQQEMMRYKIQISFGATNLQSKFFINYTKKVWLISLDSCFYSMRYMTYPCATLSNSACLVYGVLEWPWITEFNFKLHEIVFFLCLNRKTDNLYNWNACKCWTECVVVKLQSNSSNFVLLWHKMSVSFGNRWNTTTTKIKMYCFSYILKDNDPC